MQTQESSVRQPLSLIGVVLDAQDFNVHGGLLLAIVAGLCLGKPLGFLLASWLVVWLGLAYKPDAYSWRQLAGAGALAGIGFTMSLFIAGQAFPVAADYAVARVAVFAASLLSSLVGVVILWNASPRNGP